MACQWFKTQYPGVRYREHKTRKYHNRADRYFTIFYKLDGKQKEEGLGWSSEGWTAEKASITRAELKKAQTTGDGAVTLQKKRELAEEVKRAEALAKAEDERNKLTFREVSVKYISWAKVSKSTWDTDELRLRLHVLPLLGDYPMVDIGVTEVEMLKQKCYEKGMSPASVLQCLALVRALFNFAIKQGLTTVHNPVKGVKLPRPDNRRLRFLSRDEAKKLLDTASSYNMELHDICLISLYSGIRSGEMAALRWPDIDFDHELITIRDPKNGVSRQVFMTANIKSMLERRFNQDETPTDHLVFPDRKGEQRKRVSKQFEWLAAKLDLNKDIDDPRQKLCFHSLRHTFASWLALQGETLLTIKELMGHKTIAMTMRYAHLIPDQKRKAVERLAAQ